MNLRTLTWILVISIFLLGLASGWLAISSFKADFVLKKAVNSKIEKFNRSIALERENIRREMGKKYKSYIDLYSGLSKKLESEKNRAMELESVLGVKNKK